MTQRLFCFLGGDIGPWRVTTVRTVIGEPLTEAKRLDIAAGGIKPPQGAAWALRGIVSNERYATKAEKARLAMAQPGLGRPEAGCAALIPIRKSAAWWALPQDERRKIFEEQSGHIQAGLRCLPAIARRLHHCRDLSGSEPFDFLTWFEFAPQRANDFDRLLTELRGSPEWEYVEREIDIRLMREAP